MSIRLHIAIADTTTIAVPAAPASTVAEVIQAAVLRAVQAGFLSDDEQQQQRFVLCGEKKTANSNNNNFDKKPPVLFYDSDTLQDLSAEDGWHLRLLRRNKPGSAPSVTQIPLFNVRAAPTSNRTNTHAEIDILREETVFFGLIPAAAGEFNPLPFVDPFISVGKPEDYEIFCDASIICRPGGNGFSFAQILQTADTKHLPPHERTLFLHTRRVTGHRSATRIERPPDTLLRLSGVAVTTVFPFPAFLRFAQEDCIEPSCYGRIRALVLARYEEQQQQQQVRFFTSAAPIPAKTAAVPRQPIHIALPSNRNTPQHRDVMRAIEQGRIIRCPDSTMDEAVPSQHHDGWNAVEGYKFEIPDPGASPKAGRSSFVAQLLAATGFGVGFRVFTDDPGAGRGTMSEVFVSSNEALTELENQLVAKLLSSSTAPSPPSSLPRRPIHIAMPNFGNTPDYRLVTRAIEQGRIIRCADSSMHEAVPPEYRESTAWNAVEGYKFEVPTPGSDRPRVVQLLGFAGGGFRVFTLLDPARRLSKTSGLFRIVDDAVAALENDLIALLPPAPSPNAGARRPPIRVPMPGVRNTPEHHQLMHAIEQGRVIRCTHSTMDGAVPLEYRETENWNAVEGFKFEVPVAGAVPPTDPVVVQLLTSTSFDDRFRVFRRDPREGAVTMSALFHDVRDALSELEKEVISLL